MPPVRERIRLGKYLRATMVVSDFIILNIAYLLTLLFTGSVAPFCSKLVWFVAIISFIPSEWCFSYIHNVRLVYADRLVLTAFKSSVLQTCVLITLTALLDIYDIPIKTYALFFTMAFLCLSLWWVISRSILKKLRSVGMNFKRVIIIGSGSTSEALLAELRSDLGYGYRMMGVFDEKPPVSERLGGCFAGGLDEVVDFVHLNRIDIIYYTRNVENDSYLPKIMRVADEEGAEFVYVPHVNRELSGNFVASSIGSIPTMTHTLSPLHKRRNRIVKRVEDLIISSTFLAISPVIFIPIAIGVKLTSPGPIFFRQKRTGIYGRDFVCYKFRTMRVNADSDRVQATEHDPRKTKFGDFLRRTSLDELPQFFNVFIGNMSVVGPRPHMVSHTVEYSALIDKYMVRHAVKPGITGWAQVCGYRGGTKHLWQMEKRVEYDVWYIRNWNIFLDIKIILFTVINGIRGDKNAY